jgi:hypothetical protein
MELSVIEEAGVKVVEGAPDEQFISSAADADRVIEACLSSDTRCALPEMVAEERYGPHFGLFDTRDAAREWLGR